MEGRYLVTEHQLVQLKRLVEAGEIQSFSSSMYHLLVGQFVFVSKDMIIEDVRSMSSNENRKLKGY